MRFDSSVTSLSWIPSEAVTGLNKAIFGSGFTHYDDPPPDVIDDLIALRDADGFRFANLLRAWIEVVDGAITGAGYDGGCEMGATTIGLGSKQATFAAVSFPVLQHPIELGSNSVRFVQTTGGHTAVPAPRRAPRTVHRLRGSDGLDDPGAHAARRRPIRLRAGRRQHVSAALGL